LHKIIGNVYVQLGPFMRYTIPDCDHFPQRSGHIRLKHAVAFKYGDYLTES